MLGELDFYLPKSFCSTNVYGEYTEGKNLIVSLVVPLIAAVSSYSTTNISMLFTHVLCQFCQRNVAKVCFHLN